MTKIEIILSFESNFEKGFAEIQGKKIVKDGCVRTLFDLLTDLIIFSTLSQKEKSRPSYEYLKGFNKAVLTKIEFRVAYVFEYIYFYDNKFNDESRILLFSLFSKVSNESTKRHFSKLMAYTLEKNQLVVNNDDYESIASTCIDWIINPKVKVAVQVWVIECLIKLKEKVVWVPDLLEDLMLKLSYNPSAGMKVRLKRWNY